MLKPSPDVQFHKHSKGESGQKKEVVINVVQNCSALWFHLGIEFRTSMTG